jgi:hypothetical protein
MHIDRQHPRSSSLPHVETGPTASSIFGTLPVSSFLSMSSTLCDSAWISSMISNRRPFSFNFIFGNRKNSGCQIRGERRVGDDSHLVFRQKLLGEDGNLRRGVVMVKQPGTFSPKLGVDVFARLHAVAAKRSSRTQNSQFGLLGPVLRATTTAVWMAAPVRDILDTTS